MTLNTTALPMSSETTPDGSNTLTSSSLFWSLLALLLVNMTHPLSGSFGWPIGNRYLVRANPLSAVLDTLDLVVEVYIKLGDAREEVRRKKLMDASSKQKPGKRWWAYLGEWLVVCGLAMEEVVKMRMANTDTSESTLLREGKVPIMDNDGTNGSEVLPGRIKTPTSSSSSSAVSQEPAPPEVSVPERQQSSATASSSTTIELPRPPRNGRVIPRNRGAQSTTASTTTASTSALARARSPSPRSPLEWKELRSQPDRSVSATESHYFAPTPTMPSHEQAPSSMTDYNFRVLLSVISVLQYAKLFGCYGITAYLAVATIMFLSWIVVEIVYLFGTWSLLRSEEEKGVEKHKTLPIDLRGRKRRDALMLLVYLQFAALVVALPMLLSFDMQARGELDGSGEEKAITVMTDPVPGDDGEEQERHSRARTMIIWMYHALEMIFNTIPWELPFSYLLKLTDMVIGGEGKAGFIPTAVGFLIFSESFDFFMKEVVTESVFMFIITLPLTIPYAAYALFVNICFFGVGVTFAVAIPYIVVSIAATAWCIAWGVLLVAVLLILPLVIGAGLFFGSLRVLKWGNRALKRLFGGLEDVRDRPMWRHVPVVLRLSMGWFWMCVALHWGLTYERGKTSKMEWTEHLP